MQDALRQQHVPRRQRWSHRGKVEGEGGGGAGDAVVHMRDGQVRKGFKILILI